MEAMDGEMMEGMAESAAEALRFEAAAETWDAAQAAEDAAREVRMAARERDMEAYRQARLEAAGSPANGPGPPPE